MLRKSVFLVPLLFAPSLVHAGSITYTGTVATQSTELDNTITLNKFNPALGTLTSVLIEFAGNGQTTSSATNTGNNAESAKLTYTVDFSLSGASLPGTLDFSTQIVHGPVSIASGETKDFGSTPFGGSDSDLLTSNLSGFVGPGSLDFLVETLSSLSILGGGGNIDTYQSTTAGAEVKITYNYAAPAVPEPSSVVMLGLAGGLLGVVARFRKPRA